ncbi:MAG: AEC family transporter [Ruminococcaceae bacterium]|nr:AEC family transporter [Oscillospiraceae bacterium]
MLENFIYSVNVILPIFILVSLGVILKRLKVIPENFSDAVDKLIFKLGLPAMLFKEVAGSNISEALNVKLAIFAAVSVPLMFAVTTAVICFAVKDNGKRGAMIQGICRSNFAILGLPLIDNMFGNAGVQEAALIMPITIILYNTLSVVVLTVFAPKENQLPLKQTLKKILKNIVTNPLIIGVVLGLPFMFLHIELPLIADKTVNYLSNLVTPIALISLGSTVKLKSFEGRVRCAVLSACGRTIFVPAVMVTIAALIGFRGSPLGTILILFGAPTAVSSYIMAKNMGSDHELAGQILLLTTMMCLFTIFVFIFILKSLALL